MLQARLLFYFFLVVIVAVSAITVEPVKEQQVQLSLLDIDNSDQGHANVGERLARQYYGRGRGRRGRGRRERGNRCRYGRCNYGYYY